MSNEKKWPLDKYAQWKRGAWQEVQIEQGTSSLILKDSQLLLINKGIAMESVCLLGGSGAIKSSYANDNLGISIHNQGSIIKFRVRFGKSGYQSSVANCLEVVNILDKYVTITKHRSHNYSEKKAEADSIKPICQQVKELLESDHEMRYTDMVLPNGFVLEEMIQQCLLDPGFPALVAEIEKRLKVKQFTLGQFN